MRIQHRNETEAALIRITLKKRTTSKIAKFMEIISAFLAVILLALAGILLIAACVLVMGSFDTASAQSTWLFALCNVIFPLFPTIPFDGLSVIEVEAVTLGGSGLLLLFLVFFIFLLHNMLGKYLIRK